ncbi:MAG: transcriptional regulator [Candidatus Competibacteraceae bacterium]
MTVFSEEMEHHWTVIGPLLSIRNEQEYDLAVERLNGLLDEIGADERHPLYTLLDTLGTLIQAYEEQHYAIPTCKGSEVLRFLMEEHNLSEADLAEARPAEVVSEILQGQRELNIQQIRALAKRFGVAPAVFI